MINSPVGHLSTLLNGFKNLRFSLTDSKVRTQKGQALTFHILYSVKPPVTKVHTLKCGGIMLEEIKEVVIGVKQNKHDINSCVTFIH